MGNEMFNKILLANIDLEPTDDNRRKLIMTNLTLISMIIIYPIFFIYNFINEEYLIAVIELFFVFPALYTLYFLRKSHNIENAAKVTTLFLFITILTVIVMFLGKNYILLWSFIFAFVVMSLQGSKKGLYYSITFYSLVFIIAFSFIGEAISVSEYIRFATVTVLIVIIAYFYEKSTENAFKLLHKSISEITYLNVNLNNIVNQEIEKNKQKDKILEDQSRLAQMGEMISMIAHQWRQPLSSISAISGTLSLDVMMKNYNEDFFQEQLSSIDDLSQHLSGTIDDFRNFFKPNKDSQKHLIHIPVVKALDIIKASLTTQGIKIVENYESDKKIDIHVNEMIQVVLNILKNSQDNFIEKSIENPEIIINTYDEDEKIVLNICDNGEGIPENIIAKVFTPYFSTKKEKNGTGLGLYMSKIIVEKHHSATLNAKNLNGGICFSIVMSTKP